MTSEPHGEQVAEGAGPGGTRGPAAGPRFRKGRAGRADVLYVISQNNIYLWRGLLSMRLFIFKQEHSFVHTCGVAATSVLAAVTRGTLFHKCHPSQEYSFQNANHV